MSNPNPMTKELKAQELRIGNYYQYLHEEHETIHQVDTDFLETQLLYNTDPDNSCFARGWWAAPIQLDAEWLDRAGFRIGKAESSYTKYLIGDNFDLLKIPGQDEFNFYWCNDNQVTSLLYVHQLQNLYFALTGSELTFKPLQP